MSDTKRLSGIRAGFAVCGSFCTFKKAFDALSALKALGCDVTPIMSFNARSLDTRFGTAKENAALMEKITGRAVLCDIPSTEPIGPKKMFDVLVVAPCTGNTLAKLALGITDTSVIVKRKRYVLYRPAARIPLKSRTLPQRFAKILPRPNSSDKLWRLCGFHIISLPLR